MSEPTSTPEQTEINRQQAEINQRQAETNQKQAEANEKKDEKKDEKPKEEPPKPSPRKEKILKFVKQPKFYIPAAIVVALLLIWLMYNSFTHESTDDAYTTGHVHNIASRVTGTVIEVRVDDNERVRKGQVLVVLDPTDYQVQVDHARANYDKALADYNRLQPLRGDEAISQQDYDNATALLGTTKAQLNDALDQLAYCTIRSPADGRVGHKDVEAGNRVTIGGELMAVVEDTWVIANFKETQLRKMRVGQRVKIPIDAISGKTFWGRVDSFSPGSGSIFALLPSDNATGNFTKIVQRVPVKIRFDADSIKGYEDRIIPGLSCEPEVSLHGGEDKNEFSSPDPQMEEIAPSVTR